MLSSYHHVLKSMWLEGKRNRCANHLVHTLVIDMLPHYQACHDGQEVGFNGSNLAQKRHKEILVRTLEMNADSIRILGDNCYYMQSEADTSREYLVGLSEQSCDCLDWPRVQLCKHITAVTHFFENGNQLVELAADTGATPKTVQPVESEHPPDVRRDSTVASILENVINVSKEFLSDGVPKSPGTVRSLHSVEEHLTAVVRNSHSSESPLPDKEAIPPNQHTWTETAQRMGAQRWKRPRPTTTSSPEPTATERIGDLNRKQPRVRITDPYSGRVNSGRRAAPDAQSAAQNTGACACTAAAANGAEPALSQPWKNGHKRVGTPAPSVPLSPSPLQLYLPSSAAPPPALAPLAWYTAYATPSAQTAAHNTGAYACAAGPSAPGNSPPQSFAPHHMHGGTPAPSAPPPSSGHLAWYPVPTAYPPGMYTPTLYPAQYPTYWPNCHFHTPQPRIL